MKETPEHIQVLSTRMLPSGWVAKARDAGIQLDMASFIRKVSCLNESMVAVLKALAAQPITAIFTSSEAVKVVGEAVASCSPVWKIACLEPATLQAVNQYFPESAVLVTAGDGEKLAQGLVASHPRGDLHFFCGQQRREVLPQIVGDAGFTLHEHVVYQTIEAPALVRENYDGILFFSPSAVQSFFRVNKLPGTCLLFALGNTTAEALRAASSNPVIVADQTHTESLVRKVIDHFGNTDKPS